jgi:O-antigen ligase
LTAVGYGREKGNSQLAIVEETGVIGLVFYAFFLSALFSYLFRAFRGASDERAKVALGLVTGALLGMTFQSVFEAWWVAPGSPESAFFWAIAGLGLGLSHLVMPKRAEGVAIPDRYARIRTLPKWGSGRKPFSAGEGSAQSLPTFPRDGE